MRLLVAVTLLVLTTSGPASAIDADRRFGGDEAPPRLRDGLVAPLRPVPTCHLVSVVPIGTGSPERDERTLLYRPCDPPVELPPYEPYDERPPVPVPVEPQR
jgi:hypothetical protein